MDRVPGRGWLRLYPRAWRDRYEPEVLAVLESRPGARRLHADLARGALDAHVHPLTPPGPPVAAALVAGVAWIVAGVVSTVQPLIPDWPGYLLETLPIGVIGAIAALRAVAVMGRRSGLGAPRFTTPAVLVAVIGHVVWIGALVVAAVGGPYGAITGAAGSAAAIGTVLVGSARQRADDHPAAEALLMAGGAMLVPSPVAWMVAGGAWIGLAVAAVRPVRPLRAA
jgi:hypothetical protein